MRYYLLLPGVILAFVIGTSAQDGFRKSDPALLGKTGRPQLVEFYHPG